jgi:hypothetical protein
MQCERPVSLSTSCTVALELLCDETFDAASAARTAAVYTMCVQRRWLSLYTQQAYIT